jgi:hypothetical protein
VLTHWNNSSWMVDMSSYPDTLSQFRTNHSLFFHLNTVYLAEKEQIGFVLLDLLVLCVCVVDRCLYFSVWPLCCLFFFNLRILITPLVSSNSSYYIFRYQNGVHTKSCCPISQHYLIVLQMIGRSKMNERFTRDVVTC